MGGFVGMMIASSPTLITVVTVGGSTLRGYDGTNFGGTGTFGSITNPGVYLGVNVTAIFSRATFFDLQLVMSGTRVQSFFTNIEVEDGAGNIRNFTSASASSFVSGISGQTTWQWADSGSGTGGNPVYTSSDNGEQHYLIIT